MAKEQCKSVGAFLGALVVVFVGSHFALACSVRRHFDQRLRTGVGGQRGLAQGNLSHTTDSGLYLHPFSYAPLRAGEHCFGGQFVLYFGHCWSPTPSGQALSGRLTSRMLTVERGIILAVGEFFFFAEPHFRRKIAVP